MLRFNLFFMLGGWLSFFKKKLMNNRSLTNLLYKLCQSNNLLSLMKIYSQSDVCTSVHV